MDILIVGNILKDVYLNLDSSKNHFETDKNGTKWLDFSFNAGSNYFFSRNCSLGGAAVSLEVFEKLGIKAKISGSTLKLENGELVYTDHTAETYRYILISDSKASYLVPSKPRTTNFVPPDENVDYLFIDRSASLTHKSIKKIETFLDLSKSTKLILFLNNSNFFNLKPLLSRAVLFILEEDYDQSEKTYAPELKALDPKKVIKISENNLSYLNISEKISPSRVDVSTHLSVYSVAAATIIGSFILGNSVEESLKIARANIENSKLDSALDLTSLKDIAASQNPSDNLELITASLLLPGKEILSIKEPDNSLESLLNNPNLSGIALSEKTKDEVLNDGQTIINHLISHRIVPGIETDLKTTKNFRDYYELGFRFVYCQTPINLSNPDETCESLAKLAQKAQSTGFVPVLEPIIPQSILKDTLASLINHLANKNLNPKACILRLITPNSSTLKSIKLTAAPQLLQSLQA